MANMPSPFDHLDSFKKLSEDGKARVLDKFNSYDEPTRYKIMDKIKTPASVMYGKNEGVQDLGVTPVTEKDMNRSAVDVSQGLTPIVGPEIARVAGAAFEMIPPVADTAMTVAAAGGLAKAGIKSAPAMAEAVSKVGRAITYSGDREVAKLGEEAASKALANQQVASKLKQGKEILENAVIKSKEAFKQELQPLVSSYKNKIKELPIKQRKILEGLGEDITQSKLAIGAAEKELGVDLPSLGTEASAKLVKNPDAFITKYGKIANNIDPKKLADSIDTKTLQIVRKAAEEGAKSTTGAAQAEMYRISKHFRNALEESGNQLGEALSRFKNGMQAVKALPASIKQEKEMLTAGLTRITELAKDKSMTDPKLLKLNNAIEIVERRMKNISNSFAEEKATINVALEKAKNLAAKQAVIRKWMGAGVIASAVGGFGAKLGRKVAE